MSLRDTPIRRKLMTIILLTSGLVLLLTCAAFLVYELVTFRQTAVRELSTLGRIVAANSTAALAFQNPDDAGETLAALQAEPQIVAATLYDGGGRLFAHYPDSLPADAAPGTPGPDGYRFERSHVVGFQPVTEGDNRRLGTLYIRADMSAVYERLWLYGGIALSVLGFSLFVAYLLSRKLQQQISGPILALAETAKAVSDRRDYSVRATKVGQDELGSLTDAFNQMLTRIQEQNQALTESEGRVRAVVNSALSAVVATDVGGLILDWNTRAEVMFGRTRAEAVGQRLEDVILPPHDRDIYRRAVAASMESDGGALGAAPIEMAALRRDGSLFPVEWSVSPLRTSGVVTFCSFVTDITERKQAERKVHAQLARLNLLSRITRAIGERQELRSIADVVIGNLEDNLPIDFGSVCLYDPARQSLTVFGLGAKGRPLAPALEMTEGAQIPVDRNGLARCCIHGELVYEPDVSEVLFPFPQRLAAQGLRSVIVAPLLLESHVFGVLVAARREARSFTSPDCEFIRQLSEHVALAAHQAQIYTALQQAYDDLRQSQQAVLQQERLRAVGQMASGIAHDINNAISPVALYSQLLLEQEPNLSKDAREYLETIERAIDDVAATVARMREFSRQREPQVMLAPANLNHSAEQVLQLTRALWSDTSQQRGVMIETRTVLAPDLPPGMCAENEIREALTNLVFNAVHAMPEGGVLTIRTKATGGTPASTGASTPRQVHVEVTDTGIGMDEETRRRCLEPFFTTKGERGTGLGLAMVYGMVQRHSADIEIESALGKGTTVRLSFLESSVLGDAGRRAVAPAVPPRLRILIVDDDPLLLKSLRDTLSVDGHVCVTANGGREGIDAFRAARDGGQPFSVVITDLGMPYVDGRQVAGAVKLASPSTPVLLLTGWGQRMASDGDIPSNVDRLLSKPPKLIELREALVYCCDLASS
jgi:PAS domain S-box-containing protein